MAQKTLTADRSSILAWTGSAGLGGGNDTHLSIVASASGYDLRGLIGFTIPASFWTGVIKITLAELLVTNTAGAGTHVGKGGTPTVYAYRITSSWTANSAGESWSTSPAVYPGPSATSSGGVGKILSATASAQTAIPITDIVMAWAPAAVRGPSGAPGGAGVCYGIALHESGGAAQAAEIYSAKHATASQRPILRITYETNSPPQAPTLKAPLGPDAGATTFEASANDPESDPLTAYDLQVSTDPSFATITHWNLAGGTSGISGANYSRAYGGTALTNGARYYWRSRARDAGAYGPWSAGGTFVKATGGGPAPDLYDYWMAAILEDSAEGRIGLVLGEIRPRDAHVAEIVCADYGDRFHVAYDETSPPVDLAVFCLGQRVAFGRDGWLVSASVELAKEGE